MYDTRGMGTERALATVSLLCPLQLFSILAHQAATLQLAPPGQASWTYWTQWDILTKDIMLHPVNQSLRGGWGK